MPAQHHVFAIRGPKTKINPVALDTFLTEYVLTEHPHVTLITTDAPWGTDNDIYQ